MGSWLRGGVLGIMACDCEPSWARGFMRGCGPFGLAGAWLSYWRELARQAARSRRGLCAHWPLAPIPAGRVLCRITDYGDAPWPVAPPAPKTP